MHFQLIHGLPFGKGEDAELQFDVELRQLTAGDIIDAEAASERMVITPEGPALLSSPSRMGFELLRRSVGRIGKIQGPLPMEMLKTLHQADIELLLAEAEARRKAALKTAEQAAGSGR
ncbi:TPA: phage tail assembly protein [Morganella morganii]|nr:phage tail assembly protein [Morganella morganii]